MQPGYDRDGNNPFAETLRRVNFKDTMPAGDKPCRDFGCVNTFLPTSIPNEFLIAGPNKQVIRWNRTNNTSTFYAHGAGKGRLVLK